LLSLGLIFVCSAATGEPDLGLETLDDLDELMSPEPLPEASPESLPEPVPEPEPEPPADDAPQAGEEVEEAPADEAEEAEDLPAPPPPPAALAPPPSKPKTRQGKTLFAWNAAGGAAEGDLLFEADTIVELVNDEPGDGWSTGRLSGVEGVYPTAYVQELEPEPEVELPPAPSPPPVAQPQLEVGASPEEVVDVTPLELAGVSLVTVEFTQPGTLGISLEEVKLEGPDAPACARIRGLRDGTQAQEHTALLVTGLRLVSVHGTACVGIGYRDVMEMLKSPQLGQQRPLKLQIGRAHV
jgi:hypothetical protein